MLRQVYIMKKKETSKIICYVAFAIGVLFLLSSLCCYIFFHDSVIKGPIEGEHPLSAISLTQAINAEDTPPLISGLSANRFLFLFIGLCFVVFSILSYFLIKKQSEQFPESCGEVIKKTRDVFIIILGVAILACGLYGIIKNASYHAKGGYEAVQAAVRAILPNSMYLQDRIKLVSISNYPALIILGICVILLGVVYFYLWTKQEKIDSRLSFHAKHA